MTGRDYELFIDGAYVSSRTDRRLERRSPVTGDLVATYACAGQLEVQSAVASAHAALESAQWRGLSLSQRSSLILAAADAILESADELAEAIAAEVGKPMDQAQAEVREGCALWRYAAGALRSLHGQFYPSLGPDAHGYTLFEPVGVVGLILPWNFPFIVSAERLPFILAAGCTVVAKPSEYAAGASFIVADALRRAGFPKGVYNVVTGLGADAGQALVESPDVAMISFTGSTDNGRRVAETAARSFKRVSLELGGKSPCIVFANADLDKAVEGVIAGFTYNAGQCCIATTRLIVQRSCAAEVRKLLVTRLRERASSFSQPPATQAQQDKISAFVARGMREGNVLFGSPKDVHAGAAYLPTVFDNLPADSTVARDEIFGPVLSIHEFETEDEAVALANDTVYGLAACIWNGDVSQAMRIAQRVRAGRLWINSAQENYPELPVGGFGASGIGREAGTCGIRSYCEIKSVVLKG
jgi:betaine-aldehyde dehydrogenase